MLKITKGRICLTRNLNPGALVGEVDALPLHHKMNFNSPEVWHTPSRFVSRFSQGSHDTGLYGDVLKPVPAVLVETSTVDAYCLGTNKTVSLSFGASSDSRKYIFNHFSHTTRPDNACAELRQSSVNET